MPIPDQNPRHMEQLNSSLKYSNRVKAFLREARIVPYFKIKHRPIVAKKYNQRSTTD